MSDLELCYLPATEAIARFKAKTLSPVELLEALIKRAEEVEPVINAFTYCHFDEAMDKARKAEAKYTSGKRTRALEGLPIGIKDENFIAGKPTSSGSLIMKDFVADKTSVGNERILRSGGIVHARTATPEFSSAGYTNSRLWGSLEIPGILSSPPVDRPAVPPPHLPLAPARLPRARTSAAQSESRQALVDWLATNRHTAATRMTRPSTWIFTATPGL